MVRTNPNELVPHPGRYIKGREYVDPDTGECSPPAQVLISLGAIAIATEHDEVMVAPSASGLDAEEETDADATAEKKTRGRIKGFSHRSRKRACLVMSQWRPDLQVGLGTVTYPAEWPDASTVAKHRGSLIRALMKQWPQCKGMLRLEYQQRGAPHFHLVLDGFTGISEVLAFREWLREKWCRIIGGKAWTQFDLASSQDAAKYYLTKEVTKTIQGSEQWLAASGVSHEGRCWWLIRKREMRFVWAELLLPRPMGTELGKLVQQEVEKRLLKQKKIQRREDGKLYFATGKKTLVHRDYMQKWLLDFDPIALIRSLWDKMDLQAHCRRYGWLHEPRLEDFLHGGDATLLDLPPN